MGLSAAPTYNHKWWHHLSTVIPNVFAKKSFAIINIVIIIVVIGKKLIFSSPPHHLLLGSLRLFLLNRLQQDFLMEIHNWRWFWWWGVIADYENYENIQSVDKNMTITTIMTIMKMLKMSVAVSDSDSLIGKASKKNWHFLGNSPKQRTPPTHRYSLGLT